MNKQEYIRIIMLLAQLEGYIEGKVGEHIPKSMDEELLDIYELLTKKIKES